MINHAMYKSCLFLSAGSVEKQAGTTDLREARRPGQGMPVTAVGFTVCALAISGVWPLNGFVSKEMVFDGALESGYVDLRHRRLARRHLHFRLVPQGRPLGLLRATLGKSVPGQGQGKPGADASSRSSSWPLLCITFGVFNKLPLTTFIQPILEGHVEAGEAVDFTAHALSLFNPIAGFRSSACSSPSASTSTAGSAAGKKAYLASEPVHKLPVIKQIYDWAEKRVFDLYEQGVISSSRACPGSCSRGSTGRSTSSSRRSSRRSARPSPAFLRKAHTGHYANYLAWCLGGLVAIVAADQCAA